MNQKDQTYFKERRKKNSRTSFIKDEWFKTPLIQENEIVLESQIGSGIYSIVWKGTCRGIPVAIKKLKPQVELRNILVEDFKRQLKMLHQMRHPNILQLLGACVEPTNLCFVFELMKTSVHDIIHKKYSSGENEKKSNEENKLLIDRKMKLLLGAALGLLWLHMTDPPIVHSQIKPSNLLVDEYWNVKVADFELGEQTRLLRQNSFEEKQKNDDPKPFVWTAPEVIEHTTATDKSDVYSFAIVMWEIFAEEFPFQHIQTFTELKKTVLSSERPKIPDFVPLKLKDLMQWCWQVNPSSRPTFSQILPVLEGSFIDCIMENPVASNFWKQYFLSEEKVPWNTFIYHFESFLKLPTKGKNKELGINCLKKLLTNDSEEVSAESFAEVVNWFGPIPTGESKGSIFLDGIRITLSKEWFHGNISRESSLALLGNQKPGTFLVRVKTDKTSPFVISRVNKQKIIDHVRISRSSEGKLKISTKKLC